MEKGRSKYNPIVKRLAGGLLLVVYTLSFFHSGIFHLHHHHDLSTAAHFDGCEDDLCHATLYHKGVKGCDHKAHLIDEQPTCPDCRHHFLSPTIIDELSAEVSVIGESVNRFKVTEASLAHFRSINGIRGPPRMIV